MEQPTMVMLTALPEDTVILITTMVITQIIQTTIIITEATTVQEEVLTLVQLQQEQL